MKLSSLQQERDDASLRPLRDEGQVLSAELSLVSDLLGKVQPLPRDLPHQRRVWHALGRSRVGRIRSRLRFVHLVPAFLLAAAAAGATMGFDFKKLTASNPEPAQDGSAVLSAPAQAEPAQAEPAQAEPAQAEPAQAEPAQAEPALEAVHAPEAQASEAPQAPEPSLGTARSPASLPAKTKPTSKPRAPSDPEAALLLKALRARGAGDAEQMGQLAAEYRKKHPNGALQEEALVLAVEAAAARRDPNAARLARDYLRRYPNGSFRAQATRALQDAP